jgi:hypothetical protein
MNALLDATKNDKNSLSPFAKLECEEIAAPVITRGLGGFARHVESQNCSSLRTVPAKKRLRAVARVFREASP